MEDNQVTRNMGGDEILPRAAFQNFSIFNTVNFKGINACIRK